MKNKRTKLAFRGRLAIALLLGICCLLIGCGGGSGGITSIGGGGGGSTADAKEVFNLVNNERNKAGANALSGNSTLDKVAHDHSLDMQAHNNMSHTGSDGSSVADRVKRAGVSYRTCGENVARGQTTSQRVMDDWMNSPGHRANILNTAYTEIGIAVVTPGYWWTQVFIGK